MNFLASTIEKTPLNNFLLLGFGAVGKCTLQMLPYYFTYTSRITIVDKISNLNEEVQRVINTSKHKDYLSSISYNIIIADINTYNLHELIRNHEITVDLTTLTESMDVLKICSMYGRPYVNASIESVDKYGYISLGEQHLKIRQKHFTSKSTCVIEHGINPGIISHIAKYMAKVNNLSNDDIDSIHITEYDTHVPKNKINNVLYNAWSAVGLHDESTDSSEWCNGSYNNNHIEQYLYDKSSVAINYEGRNLLLQSLTPIIKNDGTLEMMPYKGFVISHGETETINHYFGSKPFVSFIFRINPTACELLKKLPKIVDFRKTDYKIIEGHEAVSGGDTIGVLMISKTLKKAWWAGSLYSCQMGVETISTIQNGCTGTTAAGILTGMEYAIKNPNKGILFPEDLDSEYILKQSMPFLGIFTMIEVPWNLVENNITNNIMIHCPKVLPDNY
jgi:homospermidine synthase